MRVCRREESAAVAMKVENGNSTARDDNFVNGWGMEQRSAVSGSDVDRGGRGVSPEMSSQCCEAPPTTDRYHPRDDSPAADHSVVTPIPIRSCRDTSPRPGNKATDRQWAVRRSALAALYYVCVSVGLTVLNKAIFSTYSFAYPLLLVEGQLLVSVLLFYGLGRWRLLTVPRWSWSTARQVLPLTASYLLMLVSGMAGLQGTSLVMYNTLRRTSVGFVMALEYALLGDVPSPAIAACVLFMTLGAAVAGIGDASFALYGYAMILLANLTTSLYIVLVKRVRQRTDLDNFGILFYNCILSLPPVVLLATVRGQHSALWRTDAHYWRGEFVWVFAAACAMGFVINHAIYYNTNTNSPLTQTVSSQAKDVVLLAASAPFDGTRAITDNALGLSVSFAGSFAYSVIKYREARNR